MSRLLRCLVFPGLIMLAACAGTVRPDGGSVEAPLAGVMVQHGHRAPVLWTALDEAGLSAASLDETGELCIWDKNGRVQARITGPGGEGSALAVSPDGIHIAAAWRDVLSFTQTLAVYKVGQREAATGAFIRSLPLRVLHLQLPHAVTALAWNPAGKILGVASQDGVRLWSVGSTSAARLGIESLPERDWSALALSGHGELLLADRTGQVRLVLLGEKRRASLVSRDMGAVSSVAFGSAGRLLLGHVSGRLRVLAAGGDFISDTILPGRIGSFVRRESSQDVVLLDGRRLALHAQSGEKRFERVIPKIIREDGVVAARGDGSVLVGYADGGLGLWRADGTLFSIPPQSPGLTSLAVSAQGQLVIGTSEGRLITFGSDLQRVRWFQAHDGRVCSLAWRPAGDLFLSTGYEGRVVMWNSFGQALRAGAPHREAANQAAWSRDGQRYATAGTWDKSIRITHRNGYEEAILLGHFEAVMAVAFAPSGRVLTSAANDSTIRLWTRGDRPSVWNERTIERMAGVESLAWSDDGEFLLAAGFEGVRRIHIASGRVENLVMGKRATGAIFAGDTVYAAMASGDLIRWPDEKVWHLPLVRLTSMADASAMVNQPAGRLIVAGSREGRVMLLDSKRDEILFAQIFADGAVLWWDGNGAWDGDPVLAGERLSRVLPGARHLSGLAAQFMISSKK